MLEMKEILLSLSLLLCIPFAKCCLHLDCNKLCKTGLGKFDDVTCKCICNIRVDDIVMPVSIWEEIEAGTAGKAVTRLYSRWEKLDEDGLIRIPFYLTAELEASSSHRNAIIVGLGVLNAVTCLKFEPAQPDDTDVIEFFKGEGCWSNIGRVGGKQQISLADGCDYVGVAQHEAMHALGFWHEQSRPDRDNYVKIFEENIISGKEHNFYKKPDDHIYLFGSPYDFQSITHYGSFDFSKNDQRTITRLDGSEVDGQRVAPSFQDQAQINFIHTCNGKRGIPETSDCYHPLDRGFSYRGTASTTISGKTCQAWSAQSPNTHKFKPELITGAGLDNNFCRNPNSNARGPWCYTTDGNTDLEACDIPVCANAVPAVRTTPLPPEGTWNEWGDYSACNRACGKGIKMRTRTCSTSRCSTGKPFQLANCKNQDCSTAEWTFGEWSGCYCSKKRRFRVRQCLGGVVNEGGCTGKVWKIEKCSCPSGPIGTWSAWGGYSSCHKACGNGKKMRVRTCSTDRCPKGKPYQIAKCKNQVCPVGIVWGPYSEWSGCHCKRSRQYRHRQCTGGFVTEGGCKGNVWQIQSCTCSGAASDIN